MILTDVFPDKSVGRGTFSVVVLLLAVSILSPSIRIRDGLPAIRLELIVVLMAWGLFLLGHLIALHAPRIHVNPAYKWFALFGVSILCSMVYAAAVKGYYPIGRDYWELGKLLEYFLIFALVANARTSSADIERYYWIALIILLFSALFGFVQYLNLWNVNAVISPYYAPTQMAGLLRHGRINGTMSNPNEFGAMMVLASSLALSGALFLRRRLSRVLSWIGVAVFVLALMYTLSRSALVALIISLVFVLFLYAIGGMNLSKFRRLMLAILLLTAIGFVDMHLVPDKFGIRAAQLGNITEAASWQARGENWRVQFSIWKESPVFGWGPAKDTMSTTTDCEWLLILRRYGLVGLAIFVTWAGSIFFGLARIRRCNEGPETAAMAIALQATLVAYAAYMIPAAIYHSLQLMPILLVFLGLAYSQNRLPQTISDTGEEE